MLEELNKHDVDFVIGLPDNTSAALFELVEHDPSIRRIGVTREGEAFALAAGIWIGGQRPVVLIQNTGLLESGDSFRGTVMRMRIPLLCLITWRGYGTLEGVPLGREPATPDLLSRHDLDSAAVVTEPTVRAWGLAHDYLHEDQDLSKVAAAFQKAEADRCPVALLIPGPLT